jgi:hypothetical protein
MSQPQDLLVSDDDDTSHVSTPILGHSPASPALPSSLVPPDSTSSDSTKPTSPLPPNAPLRLPIPTLSANLSQTSFTLVNVGEDDSGVDFGDLPPEVIAADISIAREFLCSPFSLLPYASSVAHTFVGLPAHLTFWMPLRYEIEVRLCTSSCWDYSCSPGAYCALIAFLVATGDSIFGRPFHFKLISLRLGHVGALKRNRTCLVLN